MEFDPLMPDIRKWPDRRPISEFIHDSRQSVFLVAWSPEIQRKVLDWQIKWRDWSARWSYTEGIQVYSKPGAPPFPRDPWDGTR